jgi:hypothetical protein
MEILRAEIMTQMIGTSIPDTDDASLFAAI